jgi:hypothetical protein
MDRVLEDVAETAEEAAADQHEVARQARQLDRDRSAGLSWAEALDRQGPPGLLARMRGSRRQLGAALTRISRLLAEGMVGEGESRRAIARRIGVTHQRVTALLNHRGSSSAE